MEKLFTFFITILVLLSCSSKGLRQENSSSIVKIAIMGTNDLHGAAFPKELFRKDKGEYYKYGGLVYLARLINIIRAEYGDNSIYLDTGDQYQGGVQSGPQVSKGQIIADFFNELDLKASAIGNHEFDYGQQFLFNYLNAKNSPSLGANLYSENGDPNFLPKHKSSEIFNLNGIKLGVIGLSTTETPTSTSGFISRKFPKYQFHQYPNITIRQAKKLRQQGAQIIVVLAHFGNKCPWNKTYDIRSNETQQQPCQNDEVTGFIDQLPEGTIDGILTGHRHEFVHHWHKNIPFMGSIDGGYYFNVMYFYFDTVERKVVKTQIQGPIPVCERIFENSKDCEFHTAKELLTAGPLTSWIFHNQSVYADEKIQKIFNEKYVPQMQKLNQKLVDNQLILTRIRDRQNEMANLVTSLMIKVAHQNSIPAHFSMINSGTFRSTWYPGVIQNKHFYSMFPFENYIVTFEIKGIHLKQMLKRVQGGWLGFYFMDGIHQFLSRKKVFQSNDEDNFFYQNEFINVTWLDGRYIEDQEYFTGVTLEFLLEGGDDFVKAFGESINPQTKAPYQKLPIHNVKVLGPQRKLFHEQFTMLGTIREQDWKIRQYVKPRMVILETQQKISR